jgi:DNA polymerase gamma 1
VYGWTFKVSTAESQKYEDQSMTRCDMLEEENLRLRDDLEHDYFKLPHKDGASARCSSPLAKGYLNFFEQGTLSSEFAYAKEALKMNASCSYWMSARDRIRSQMVVYNAERPGATDLDDEQGFILPQVIPMGTITRRAVENTWLTAANAKSSRVGSELKSMVTAPPGYSFIGADVDSQELWIASLVGDASFKIHGGNAIGFMTLEGTKSAGTDLHSRTASILGISRNDAKIFNYGRIYGAGLTFAQSLLRQFNPTLREEDAKRIAENLYLNTKGKKRGAKLLRDRKFWTGGTESLVFNKLEDFAEEEKPRTPVLGAGITEALMRRYINAGGFMTSRINWAIQSSGVDYLHLLIVSMDYLCRRYNIQARLALTVHDEIRYLSKNEDKYRTAMALQVANVWTRAMFSQQMGIDDLPQSCAYFSAVDIDHVLRKEVDMDCITPSHPNAIPPGESIDIVQLLARGQEAYLDPSIQPIDPPQLDRWTYTPRTPVMETLKTPRSPAYLRAQISSETSEFNKIIKTLKSPTKSSTATPKLSSTERSQQPRAPRKRTVKSSAAPAQKQTQRYYTKARSLPMDFPVDWDAQENLFMKYPTFSGYDDMPSGRPIKGNTAINLGLMKGKLPNGVDARANWISGH